MTSVPQFLYELPAPGSEVDLFIHSIVGSQKQTRVVYSTQKVERVIPVGPDASRFEPNVSFRGFVLQKSEGNDGLVGFNVADERLALAFVARYSKNFIVPFAWTFPVHSEARNG